MGTVKKIAGGKLIGVKTSTYTIFNQEKYDSKVIPAAWSLFFEQYRQSSLPHSAIFYSAAIPSMSLDIPMDYYAGAIFEESVEVPVGFESVSIPEGNYFCVTHNGPISNLAATFAQAYGVELPESQAEMRNAPHLEIYNSDKDPMAEDYSMELGIPVQ